MTLAKPRIFIRPPSLSQSHSLNHFLLQFPLQTSYVKGPKGERIDDGSRGARSAKWGKKSEGIICLVATGVSGKPIFHKQRPGLETAPSG